MGGATTGLVRMVSSGFAAASPPQTLMTPSSPGSSPETWHPVQQALPIGLPNDFETVRSEMYFLKTIVLECPKIDNLRWKRRPDSFGACRSKMHFLEKCRPECSRVDHLLWKRRPDGFGGFRSEMYFLQSVVQNVQKWTIYRGNADPTALELFRSKMYFLQNIVQECSKVKHLPWKRRPSGFGGGETSDVDRQSENPKIRRIGALRRPPDSYPPRPPRQRCPTE